LHCTRRERVLPGLVGGDGLLEVLEPKLELIRAQLLGATAELVPQQTLDQQSQLVVFSVQLAMLEQQRPQHLLQRGGVVRQGIGIDLHGADAERRRRVAPSGECACSPGQFRPGARDRGSPFAAVE
jgi:hypothetical protein